MEGKRKEKQKLGSLEKFLKLVIIPIEKLCWREIDEFRKNWEIPGEGFKTEKELKNWYKTTKKRHPEKKYNVVYREHELEVISKPSLNR